MRLIFSNHLATLCIFSLVLSGCSSLFKHQNFQPELALNLDCDFQSVKSVNIKDEKKSPIGNPLQYQVLGRTYTPMQSLDKNYQEIGLASWYGPNFVGKKTSTGEVFDPCELSAAHRTVPIPSYFLVKNLENNKELVVKVNDRGPFIEPDERIIDLSYMAAQKLGFVEQGKAKVKIRSLSEHQYTKAQIIIQAGAFQSLNQAKKVQRKIQSIPTIEEKVKISQDQDKYKLQILATKQNPETISHILNRYKIDHFITTIFE